MALRTWWDGDPEQRYWMEIATTEVGELLQSPKFPGATWSYELVGEVRPGDRILHWRSGRGRGLVGWSEVVAEPMVVPRYTWQPRGTAGRALTGPRTTEGWRVQLGGLRAFPSVVPSEALQAVMAEVLAVEVELEAKHGEHVYFPFCLYGGRQLRAQQGYLVKFPVELFEVIEGIEEARIGLAQANSDEVPEDDQPETGRQAPKGRVARAQDPVLRSAIEQHAVAVAKAHYRSLGAAEGDIEELGKPYDLRVKLAGVERHVEVKGSSMVIATVQLTTNEVAHARRHQPTDLVVVDGIDWNRSEDGSIATAGGRQRVWSSWSPLGEDLAVLAWAYNLPPEA